ncbi:DUF2975 domain-containing protein [Dethiosulfatarculus sandiegensis]|uniref:DUF2975 domain-containing protein n=1 Tax=Dethiosulfatarculus sandiegensis TaxID=1429043 RepID=A0A0D2J1Z1_9BACT|nr:DUF2975 domain-containing protein [Dethiosulfatarculus sandiegensis]KIX12244.1 hypothetical protein X474_19660 [Dethiosulfatarculus sandiegensis]
MDSMSKIKNTSRKLRFCCLGIMIATPIVIALAWINLNHYPALIRELPIKPMAELPATALLLGFGIDMISASIIMYAVYKLYKLFGLYGEGRIFNNQVVNCYRMLGRVIIIAVPLGILEETLMVLMITFFTYPPGQRLLSIGLSNDSFMLLFIGVSLLTASWVMDEARKLKEDQELII